MSFNSNIDSWHPIARVIFWTLMLIWFLGMLFSPFYGIANGIYD